MKVFFETKLLVMTILCAICVGTTNTNTQNNTNYGIFFKSFLSVFEFF